MHRVCAGDGRAQSLDGWEDLLVEVPFYVRLQGRGGGEDVLGREGAFGDWVGGWDVGGGGGGHDVGDYIVDADGFALGEGAERDLHLRHGVWVGVVSGIFAEFLGMVRK